MSKLRAPELAIELGVGPGVEPGIEPAIEPDMEPEKAGGPSNTGRVRRIGIAI